jgi:hypothetical protein
MKVEAHRMASERKAVTVFLQMMLNTKYKEQQQGQADGHNYFTSLGVRVVFLQYMILGPRCLFNY